MSRCQTWAAALGHDVLHLYTERGSGAEQLYERLGWQVIRHDQYDGIAESVMRKHLDQAAEDIRPDRMASTARPAQ